MNILPKYITCQLNYHHLFIVYLWEVFCITKWPVIPYYLFSSSNCIFCFSVIGLCLSCFYFLTSFYHKTAVSPHLYIHSLVIRTFFLIFVYVKMNFLLLVLFLILLYRILHSIIKFNKSIYHFFSCVLCDFLCISNIILLFVIILRHYTFYLAPSFVFYFCEKKTHFSNIIYSNISILTIYILMHL
jgi:hypothetical protein